MRKTVGVLASGLLLAAMIAPRAEATTAIRLSNDDLTDQADLIVVGRAVDQETRWVGRNLVTLVTVAVTEAIKGEAVGSITVALPGGIDAKRKFPVAMTYAGAPRLSANEEVFLFLTAGDEVEGSYAVSGFSQGKFSIVEEAGEKKVSRDLSELNLSDPRGLTRGTRSLTPLSLFKDEVRRRLAGR
jgi:hypothetical protein